MNILFVAGGTAGHINPAIAIADFFKNNLKDVNIKFVGNNNDKFKNLIQNAGFECIPINVAGLQRKLNFKNIARNVNALYLFTKAQFTAKHILKSFKPNFVLGTGGYTCAAILNQAAKMGIKTAIHEQNAQPGFTNKMLARKVDLVFLAVKEAKLKLPPCNSVVVGNPIRKQILTIDRNKARRMLNLDDSFCILSFGGSLGALKINEIAADLMQWHSKFKKINHIHATGKLGYNYFLKMAADRKINLLNNPKLIVKKYIYNMDLCLASCDLVICRAGALTLAELQATATPAILVPSPNVSHNHQFHNAMVLQKQNAAIVVEEKNYDKTHLINVVKNLSENQNKLNQFKLNLKKMATLNSTQLIFDNVMNLINMSK